MIDDGLDGKNAKQALYIYALFQKICATITEENCSKSHLAESAVFCISYVLLDMFDKTRSGRMDLFGFSALWDFMQRWRAYFQQYDRDRSGCISGAELHQGIPCFPVC